jgi:hypothetical protein
MAFTYSKEELPKVGDTVRSVEIKDDLATITFDSGRILHEYLDNDYRASFTTDSSQYSQQREAKGENK